MVHAVAELLSLLEKSGHSSSQVPSAGKHQTHFKGIKEQGPGKSWPISLTSVPWKILLKDISRHMDVTEVIKDSWHGFTKDKSCLLTWRPSTTEWLHWWIRKVHLMSCTLTSGLWHSSAQHLLSKLERWVWWMRNWLDGRIQSISQWFSVQKDITNKWCPSRACTGADTVQPSLMAQTECPLSRLWVTPSWMTPGMPSTVTLGQAWGAGPREPHEVQHSQVWGAARESGQPLVLVHTGGRMDWEP